MNMQIIKTSIILLTVCFHDMKATGDANVNIDDIQSNTSTTLINDTEQMDRNIAQATIMPIILSTAYWIGEGAGYSATKWIINRINAAAPGSIVRYFNNWATKGNALAEYGPIGAKIGGNIASFASTLTTICLVNRYYLPWKRFIAMPAKGELNWNTLKQGDIKKIAESVLLGSSVAYLIYLDLMPKKK